MRFPTSLRDGKLRPIVSVNVVISSGRSVLFDALVDTGSDVSLFPNSTAIRLGLDLIGQPTRTVTTAVGGQCQYWPCEVTLELRRFPETFRWNTKVGFVDHPMSYAVLGTRGLFEFFRLTFDAHEHWLELTPRAETVSS